MTKIIILGLVLLFTLPIVFSQVDMSIVIEDDVVLDMDFNGDGENVVIIDGTEFPNYINENEDEWSTDVGLSKMGTVAFFREAMDVYYGREKNPDKHTYWLTELLVNNLMTDLEFQLFYDDYLNTLQNIHYEQLAARELLQELYEGKVGNPHSLTGNIFCDKQIELMERFNFSYVNCRALNKTYYNHFPKIGNNTYVVSIRTVETKPLMQKQETDYEAFIKEMMGSVEISYTSYLSGDEPDKEKIYNVLKTIIDEHGTDIFEGVRKIIFSSKTPIISRQGITEELYSLSYSSNKKIKIHWVNDLDENILVNNLVNAINNLTK